MAITVVLKFKHKFVTGSKILEMNDGDSQVTDSECNELALDAYDIIRTIKDPEKSENLEELNVVQEDLVKVCRLSGSQYLISVEFVPTVPHCTLATLIGKHFVTFLIICKANII